MEKNSPISNPEVIPGNEWNANRIAAIVLMITIGSVLVWSAYTPEDIYLSDLKYDVLQYDRLEPQNNRSAGGGTITIHETYYPKGIGVHADSEIQMRFLPQGYRFFIAEIGIDQESPAKETASVIFSILSDGTLFYESPVMRFGMPPRALRIPIEGRISITLKVSAPEAGIEGVHADWAMARFVAR